MRYNNATATEPNKKNLTMYVLEKIMLPMRLWCLYLYLIFFEINLKNIKFPLYTPNYSFTS